MILDIINIVPTSQ